MIPTFLKVGEVLLFFFENREEATAVHHAHPCPEFIFILDIYRNLYEQNN